MELGKYKNKFSSSKKKPPHEKSASVDEIIKLVGLSKTYDYGYWLKKVGTASFSTVLGILKEASSLEAKYSKGGFICNRLKPYGRKPSTTPRTDG